MQTSTLTTPPDRPELAIVCPTCRRPADHFDHTVGQAQCDRCGTSFAPRTAPELARAAEGGPK